MLSYLVHQFIWEVLPGEMQSFLERLVFPYLTYTDPPAVSFPKKIHVRDLFIQWESLKR